AGPPVTPVSTPGALTGTGSGPHSGAPAPATPPGMGPATPQAVGPAAGAPPGSGPAAGDARGFAPGRAAASGTGFGGQPGSAPAGPYGGSGQPGPAWAISAAGPHPGGHGSAQERHAGSGVPPTLEEPAEGRKGRARLLALAGAAGVVLVAGLTAGAVAVLRSPDDPAPRPATLAGESAVADPAVSVRPGTGTTPGASPSRTGRPSRTPSATPTRSAAGGTPSGGAQPTPGDTGAPAPGPVTSSPAAKQPYTATQVCGSGYQVIDSATLTADGVRKGRVYLLYNTGSGTNCVVTLKDTDVGRATTTSTYLEVQGKTRQTQSGAYKFYAGPVRATAPGVCVKWGGSTGGASYGSPFEHCG
ncbi:hypothetical protein, partial [Micromonospora sp. NPDC003776]